MREKKLIIVCDDDKTISYGNTLKELIEDDESIEVDILLEKDYREKISQISSNTYTIFIGKNNITDVLQTHFIDMKFSKFGIKYGWFGKDLILSVDKKLNKEEYGEFLKFSEEQHEKFEKARYKKKWIGVDVAIGLVGLATGGLGLLAASGIMALQYSMYANKIKEQQYSFGIVHLYLNGLSDFLEG